MRPTTLSILILLMSGTGLCPSGPPLGNTSGEGFEGERFFDLVRWGIVETTMNKYITAESDNRIYYANAHFTGGKDEYYPFRTINTDFLEASMYRIPVMLRSTNYILK